ncbi:MAG TPA: MurT ligase domain-containing protein [Candidatus Dormibacteraeota bacterium]
MGLRLAAAVTAGKATAAASRLARRGGGATLPGDVARWVDRDVLRDLSRQLSKGAVLITGTNGKTTTSRLVSLLLEEPGRPVLTNRTGANLIYGLTAAAVAAAGPGGGLRRDWAVLEVDEATLPLAVEEVQPRLVLVGNLFRDQLDRYGELEKIARLLHGALTRLPDGATAVLNADDPRVGEIGLALERPPVWYGLDSPNVARPELPHAADARVCPRCGRELEFAAVYVGHEGDYRCPESHFHRPDLTYAGHDVRLDGLDGVELTVEGSPISLPLGALFNAYNLLAAYSIGRTLGLEQHVIADRLRDAAAAFGRLERIEARGRRLTILLAKNPASFNEVLLAATELADARQVLLALNDRIADGRDVSWIWDVDFEVLGGREGMTIVPSGLRAYDLAVRLKYAEVGGVRAPQPDFGPALDQLLEATPQGGDCYLLCTYTAMLEMRAEITRRGWARPYWQT